MCKYTIFLLLTLVSTGMFVVSLTASHTHHAWALPFYGAFILMYFVSQLILAVSNRRQLRSKQVVATYPPTALLIVGYREDPLYWSACLQSATEQTLAPCKTIVCIDGDETEDEYMVDIATDILEKDAVVVSCVHGGKRSAMSHGFRLLQEMGGVTYVVVTDSDTRFDRCAIEELVSAMEHFGPSTACATGSLRVFSKGFLPRLIDARYAYAFNVERAAMSAVGVMNCCSGPLSIYRAPIVTEASFIDEFLGQTCCGQRCGPGDDRHLTCMLLKRGYQSHQTHLAIATTEAPDGLLRFLRQQCRWIRSFYREVPHQVRAIQRQHIALAVISHYELMYPYFLLGWVVHSLVFQAPSLSHGLRATGVAVALAMVRTVVLMSLHEWEWALLSNVLYLPIYFFAILPLKPLALLTCNIMDWSTEARLYGLGRIKCDLEMTLILGTLLVWNGFLVGSGVSCLYQAAGEGASSFIPRLRF